MKKIIPFAFIALLFLLLSAAPPRPCIAAEMPSLEEIEATAEKAFLFGLPIVMNYQVLYEYALNPNSPEFKGPLNDFKCEARVFTSEDTAVITPNSDTPYCMGWMDLSAEPLVLTVPRIADKRYYSFQLIDFYTHIFSLVGTLTTGNEAGSFLLAGPDWQGEPPEGITAVFRSETNLNFILARTQLLNSEDLANVVAIQQQYQLEPLSKFTNTTGPALSPPMDFPSWEENALGDIRFFIYLDFALGLLKKPSSGEEEIWADLARLGIGPAGMFSIAKLSSEEKKALEEGMQKGQAQINVIVEEYGSNPLTSAKIFGSRKFLEESARTNFAHENHHLIRATGAFTGIYGLSGEEAIYPSYFTDSEGTPLDAAKNAYTLSFPADKLPPAKAFWSLTMYDLKTQLFSANLLDRYLLNSAMLDQFVYAEDGSLTLYISHKPPQEELIPNWLPAPKGPFYMVLRLYGPKPEALSGKWTHPPVIPVE